MATLYEHNDTHTTVLAGIYPPYWPGQTFTVGAVGHTITSVKLWLHRLGSPGDLTVSIRATDGDGKPTGADLTSGTINGNNLAVAPGSEYEISLTEYTLAANTKYAICTRCLKGDTNNACGITGGGNDYAAGSYAQSNDSGVTWSLYTAYDVYFQIMGNPLISYYKIYVRYVHLVK